MFRLIKFIFNKKQKQEKFKSHTHNNIHKSNKDQPLLKLTNQSLNKFLYKKPERKH